MRKILFTHGYTATSVSAAGARGAAGASLEAANFFPVGMQVSPGMQCAFFLMEVHNVDYPTSFLFYHPFTEAIR